MQVYEVTVDDDNVSWRNSSIRVRFYDPAQGYRISRGFILRSERDQLTGRVIRPPGPASAAQCCAKRPAATPAVAEPAAKRPASAAPLQLGSTATPDDTMPSAARPLSGLAVSAGDGASA
jgi:hypothetical protein